MDYTDEDKFIIIPDEQILDKEAWFEYLRIRLDSAWTEIQKVNRRSSALDGLLEIRKAFSDLLMVIDNQNELLRASAETIRRLQQQRNHALARNERMEEQLRDASNQIVDMNGTIDYLEARTDELEESQEMIYDDAFEWATDAIAGNIENFFNLEGGFGEDLLDTLQGEEPLEREHIETFLNWLDSLKKGKESND